MIAKRFVTSAVTCLPPLLSNVLTRQTIPNLAGDRDVEWAWVLSQMPKHGGQALDFGCGSSFVGLAAALCGFDVTAINLTTVNWHYIHPRLSFIQKDFFEIQFANRRYFDLIINCSTVEHIGLFGRYGSTPNANGDFEAMARLQELIKANGVMLLTIPIGEDALYPSLHRVYGNERLPRLLSGYSIDKEVFWLKNKQNQWQLAERKSALNYKSSANSWNPLKNIYGLGCFVLKSL